MVPSVQKNRTQERGEECDRPQAADLIKIKKGKGEKRKKGRRKGRKKGEKRRKKEERKERKKEKKKEKKGGGGKGEERKREKEGERGRRRRRRESIERKRVRKSVKEKKRDEEEKGMLCILPAPLSPLSSIFERQALSSAFSRDRKFYKGFTTV